MSKNARKKAKLREKKKERGAKDDASSDLKGMPEMIGLLGVDLFYMRESLLSCRFAIGYPHLWILFLVQSVFVWTWKYGGIHYWKTNKPKRLISGM